MRNIKKYFTLLLLLPLGSMAQNKEVLSLPEVFQKIDSNNLLLQSFGPRSESFKYKADAATAWMPPMVGIGTWQLPYPGQEIMDARDKGMLMFRAEQEIPNRAKQNATRRFIESQGDVALANRAVALNQMKSEARRQYYSWLIAVQKLKILRKNEVVLATMKKIEEVRYPYNQSQLGNVYRADAALEDNRAMMQMQFGEIAGAKGYLSGLMNRDHANEFLIDTSYEVVFVPAYQSDTAFLARARSDVFAMNENLRSMQLNISAMQARKKPDFKVQFDHMVPLDNMMPKGFSIMGMVTIPIAPWSSRMYKSDIRAMELDIRAMEIERSAMLQEVHGILNGMQGEIRSMQKRMEVIESKVIPALQKAFDADYLLYQENRVSITALLNSWEALNMMQIDLLDEKLRYYQMIADYEKELYR